MTNKDYILHNFISEKAIKTRITELGKEIANDYEGKSLLMVGVLKGSVVFLSDLIREIPQNVDISFITVSSYGSNISSAGSVRLVCDIDEPLRGRDVLIIEDIIDSGYTMKFLLETFEVRQPNSLKVCTLLDKPSRRLVDINVDYNGFVIEDKFVVGYGMDYNGKYRNLPNIAVVDFNK